MTSKPVSYKICPDCGEEYVENEKVTTKKEIILRHNKTCPVCGHKYNDKRR